MKPPILTTLAAAAVCLAPATLPAAAPASSTIESPAVWAGQIDLENPVVVKHGARLSIRPGTRVTMTPEASLRVEGELYALGTTEAPVRIQGSADSEAAAIEANEPEAVVRLHETDVIGAKSGVVVRGGLLVISSSRFRANGNAVILDFQGRGEFRELAFDNNEVGLSVGNTASARGRDLTFRKNQVAIGAQNSAALDILDGRFVENAKGYTQRSACKVTLRDCAFERNEVGVDLHQTGRSPALSFSRFQGNQTAIAAAAFSHPMVEACDFEGNRIALSSRQFCGPLLRYNLFVANDEAVRLDRKCNARIENNRFEGNEVALFADFSSYPKVKGNLFTNNEWHVRLGIYQSSDWERRQGSRGIMMGVAREAGTRNPVFLRGELPSGEGVFSVTDNAWDEETLGEIESGPESNISKFWDGKDQATATYEGYGEEAYAIDEIEFLPPVDSSGLAVGPRAWIPMSNQAATAQDRPEGPPKNRSDQQSPRARDSRATK